MAFFASATADAAAAECFKRKSCAIPDAVRFKVVDGNELIDSEPGGAAPGRLDRNTTKELAWRSTHYKNAPLRWKALEWMITGKAITPGQSDTYPVEEKSCVRFQIRDEAAAGQPWNGDGFLSPTDFPELRTVNEPDCKKMGL